VKENRGSTDFGGKHWTVGFLFETHSDPMAYPGILFGGGSTNSVEDRGQRERGSGGSRPLFRGSTQFANE
jgi:hypothetical protein